MISWRSCTAFVYVNGFIVGLATVLHNWIPSIIVSTFVNNAAVVLFLHQNVKRKEDVHPVSGNRIPDTWWDVALFGSTSLLQAATHWYLLQGYVVTTSSWLCFLHRLFLFEVLLDLGHYTAHRVLHTQRWLYPIHKWHHKYTRPTVLNTFYHHPVDIFLLDCVPTVFSLSLLRLLLGSPVFTPWQLQTVMVYKTFVEVAGHTGKRSAPTGSFPLCIWLPRWLDISLYTEDHDLHHRVGACNYGKRFSLWDRVCGTYA